MSRGSKLFLSLVLLAVIALLKWQVITLGDSLDAAKLENVRVAAALTESRAAIAALQDSALRNEREQVMLRQRIAAADQLATRRNHTITRLLNENEALRRWYQSALPDDVIRLHTRPDFATPTIIYAGCRRSAVARCPAATRTNGDLSAYIFNLERALASCALQVETVKKCQEELDVKAEKSAPSAL